MNDEDDLTAQYASALASYLAGGGETALHAAYQVGRRALEGGVGPLVLFSIHRDLVSGLSAQSGDPTQFTSDATSVFIETLAPFQMAYAGLDAARGAVAELGSMIDRQAEDLSGIDVQLNDIQRAADTLQQLRSMIDRHLGDLNRLRGKLQQAQQTAEARRTQIASIVGAQEQERQRLAHEIHDDAVQAMTAVLLRLGALSRQLSAPEQRADVEQLEQLVGNSIAGLRRLLAGLRPPELDRSGVTAAVDSLLQRLESDLAIRCTLTGRLDPEPDPETRTIAFRIIQEALTNIRKHANATRVEVTLKTSNDGILARIADNGVGFDARAVSENAEPGHLGLIAMRERASLAGGWLKIDSSHNGTTVEFWIPDTEVDPAP